MQVEIIDPIAGLDETLFKTCVGSVLSGEDKTAEYVNIIFKSRDDLRLMKKEYFGRSVYTDVIAFNLNDPGEDLEGEIYLSHEQIRDNAVKFSTDPDEELLRVLIHGCLHLCGYEDETPALKDEMTRLENMYLQKLDKVND